MQVHASRCEALTVISPSRRLGLRRPVERPNSSGSPSKQRTRSSESGGRCLNSAGGVGGNRVCAGNNE